MEIAPLLKSSASAAAAATLFNSGEAKFALRVSSSLVSCQRIGFGRQNASFLWPVLLARPLTTDLALGCGGSGSKRRARGPVMAAEKKASDGGIKEEGKYKHTVDLPKTTFGMRANAVVREPEIQKLWEENQVFKRLSDRNTGRSFVLHDGPPYANGSLHMGHALNKILKDIINRYKLLCN